MHQFLPFGLFPVIVAIVDVLMGYGAEKRLPWGVAGGHEVGGWPPEKQRAEEAAAGEREVDRRQEHRGGGRQATRTGPGPEARRWRRHHCQSSLLLRFPCLITRIAHDPPLEISVSALN